MSDRIVFSKPQSKAYRYIKPNTTVCLPFGRGTGKSWFDRTVVYLLVSEWDGHFRPGSQDPGIRIVLLLPTLEQFRKVHLQPLINELGGRWAHIGGQINRSTMRITFPGGSWIQAVSAEAAEGSRGIRCDVVVADEADDIEPEVMEAIANPWFTEPHSLRIRIISGTPKRGRYGLLYRAYREWPKLGPQYRAVHATSYDAPEHVSREYLDQIRAITDPKIFAREYLCDFDSSEGLVYDMFSEDFHIRAAPKNVYFSQYIVGQDWGYEDAGVQLVAGIQGNGKDATAWLIDETYVSHKTIDFWTENTKRIISTYGKRAPVKFYCDPSQPASIQQIKDKTGANMVGADNSIEDGVASLADRLLIRVKRDAEEREVEKYAKFYVHPSCENTIREFGLYRRKRDPKNRERSVDAIEDRNNHAMDAARYLCFGHFGKPESKRVERPGTDFQRG